VSLWTLAPKTPKVVANTFAGSLSVSQGKSRRIGWLIPKGPEQRNGRNGACCALKAPSDIGFKLDLLTKLQRGERPLYGEGEIILRVAIREVRSEGVMVEKK
jgi:hypothetical protein